MSNLRNARCYLCGAMDRTPDGGSGWRKRIRHELNDLGIIWLDPTRKPISIAFEDDASRKMRRDAKLAGDYDRVVREMNPIRRVDLRMVDVCDFLVVNLNINVHACGTYEEIFLANRQKKPMFIHIEQGKQYAPDWLFGTLPHQYFHSRWEDLYTHVCDVAYSDNFKDTTGRWYFFDWMGGATEPSEDWAAELIKFAKKLEQDRQAELYAMMKAFGIPAPEKEEYNWC